MASQSPVIQDNLFRVLQWNARSIFDKVFYFRELAIKYHLVYLQETWLAPGSAFQLDGNFTLARNDRTGCSGGTAIAV